MSKNTEEMIERPDYDGTQNCYGLDTDFFYVERDAKGREEHYQMLRTICSDCPFLNECALYALHHEDEGFWGGMTALQRKMLRRSNKIKFKRINSYGEASNGLF